MLKPFEVSGRVIDGVVKKAPPPRPPPPKLTRDVPPTYHDVMREYAATLIDYGSSTVKSDFASTSDSAASSTVSAKMPHSKWYVNSVTKQSTAAKPLAQRSNGGAPAPATRTTGGARASASSGRQSLVNLWEARQSVATAADCFPNSSRTATATTAAAASGVEVFRSSGGGRTPTPSSNSAQKPQPTPRSPSSRTTRAAVATVASQWPHECQQSSNQVPDLEPAAGAPGFGIGSRCYQRDYSGGGGSGGPMPTVIRPTVLPNSRSITGTDSSGSARSTSPYGAASASFSAISNDGHVPGDPDGMYQSTQEKSATTAARPVASLADAMQSLALTVRGDGGRNCWRPSSPPMPLGPPPPMPTLQQLFGPTASVNKSCSNSCDDNNNDSIENNGSGSSGVCESGVADNQFHLEQQQLQQELPLSSQVPMAEALYDYQSSESSDLCFRAGDRIQLLECLNGEWLRGRRYLSPANHHHSSTTTINSATAAANYDEEEHEGLFPAAYVQIIVPLDEAVSHGCTESSPPATDETSVTEAAATERLACADSSEWPSSGVTVSGRAAAGACGDNNNNSTTAAAQHRNSEPVRCMALYDFDSDHQEDLTFATGDYVMVSGKINEEWGYGCRRGCYGQFPLAYIEVDPSTLDYLPD